MSTAEVRGRFVWHELLTTDTAAAASFYAKVAGWRSQPANVPGYTIFMAGQIQLAGLVALPPEAGGAPPHWIVYIGTPDVDACCAQAQSLGGRIHKAATDIPNVGRFAVLTDPQGASFAVFTPAGSPPPPPPAQPASGGFSWHELATTDVAGALRFYGALFGWSKGVGHDMGPMGVYQLFEHAGNAVGGMCNTQGPQTPPSWLSYVHVADANRAVAAVRTGGGRLLHGPTEVPGGSWIALFLDPQGGAFAVQEPPRGMSARATAAPAQAKSAPKTAAPPPTAARKPALKRAPPKKKKQAKRAAARRSTRKTAARKSARVRPVKRKAAKRKTARRGVRGAARRRR